MLNSIAMCAVQNREDSPLGFALSVVQFADQTLGSFGRAIRYTTLKALGSNPAEYLWPSPAEHLDPAIFGRSCYY